MEQWTRYKSIFKLIIEPTLLVFITIATPILFFAVLLGDLCVDRFPSELIHYATSEVKILALQLVVTILLLLTRRKQRDVVKLLLVYLLLMLPAYRVIGEFRRDMTLCLSGYPDDCPVLIDRICPGSAILKDYVIPNRHLN